MKESRAASLVLFVRAQGDDAGALAHYHRCLSLWQDGEASLNSAMVLDSIAEILGRMGDPWRGATLMSAATTIREQASAKLATNEQASRHATMLACRMALGESAFAAAWAKGRALTLAQAISLALEPPVRLCSASPLAA